MKKSVLATIVICVIGLSACRSAPPPVQRSKEVLKKATVPEIGVLNKAGIGEELLMSGMARSVELLVIPSDQIVGDVVIRRGKYAKIGHGAEYRNFRVSVLDKDRSKPGRQGSVYLFSKDAGTKLMCVSRNSCAEADFTTEEVTDFQRAASQQTLIYSGRIGNRITLGYREFNRDMARPAFNNDVAYDLNESRILGYKGARIEVIEASNTEITYKVLSDFN
jgi:hypothetical protein